MRRLSGPGRIVAIVLLLNVVCLSGAVVWQSQEDFRSGAIRTPLDVVMLLLFGILSGVLMAIARSAGFIALVFWTDRRSRVALAVVAAGTLVHSALTIRELEVLMSESSLAAVGLFYLGLYDVVSVGLTGLVAWIVGGRASTR